MVIPLEQALTERAQAGDERAFRRIYDRYSPGVYRFLRDQLGGDAAADEATQETFVRAHLRLGAMRDPEKLAPFLFGIARKVVLEQIRAKRRIGDDDVDDVLEVAPDASPSPEAILLGREADELFAVALARLSDERRAALLLLMDHGLSYDEIASVMDWSLAKVKVELHRARQKLRAELAKYLGGTT